MCLLLAFSLVLQSQISIHPQANNRSTENSLLKGTKSEQDQVDRQMGKRGGEGERNRNRVLLLSFVVMTQRILIILFDYKYNHVSVPWGPLLTQEKGVNISFSPVFFFF